MRHVEKYESAYRVLGRWAIDMVLFAALIIAVLAFLASAAKGQESSTPSPVRNCLEDYGFPNGCKIDRGPDGQYECDGELLELDWHRDFELLDFSSTVPIDLVAAKAGQGYEDHFFDPAVTSAEDLTAFQGRKHSHDLFCWDDPGPDLGSCCLDCEPGSGGEDSCEDEATEAWCDEEGGRWEVNTLCGEREDCQDQCPAPRGSCCVGCVDGSGNHDECEDGVVEESCSGLGGSWLEDVECTQRDDCNGFCPEPVGAVCRPNAPPPDAGAGANQCVEDISLAQCSSQFGEDYCATFWQLGETCATINCPDPVPTMPNVGLAILLVLLLGGAMTVFHIKFMPTDRPVG